LEYNQEPSYIHFPLDFKYFLRSIHNKEIHFMFQELMINEENNQQQQQQKLQTR